MKYIQLQDSNSSDRRYWDDFKNPIDVTEFANLLPYGFQRFVGKLEDDQFMSIWAPEGMSIDEANGVVSEIIVDNFEWENMVNKIILQDIDHSSGSAIRDFATFTELEPLYLEDLDECLSIMGYIEEYKVEYVQVSKDKWNCFIGFPYVANNESSQPVIRKFAINNIADIISGDWTPQTQ